MSARPALPAGQRATGETVRSRAHHGGLTPLLVSALVGLVCLGATLWLWHAAQQEARRALRADFEFRTRETRDAVTRRMAIYEQVLRSTQAFLDGSVDVDPGRFHAYVSALDLDLHYPGIQGIAIARLQRPDAPPARAGVPVASDPDSLAPGTSSITLIEPMTVMNRRALGYDMLRDSVRRAAMAQARDTGSTAVSQRVTLIQESGQRPQAGIVMYFPVYGRGLPVEDVAQRRAAIVGWLGAPFRMRDLMASLGGERTGDLRLRIYDRDAALPAALLFDSRDTDVGAQGAGAATLAGPLVERPAATQPAPAAGSHPDAHQPLYASTLQVVVAGQPWRLAIDSSAAFDQRLDHEKPRLILASGSALALLLALLFWSLATARGRALKKAQEITQELRASEFRWKFALEGAGEGVWDWHIPSSEVYFSPQWKAMLGYDSSAPLHTLAHWRTLLHPLDAEAVDAALQRYFDGHARHYTGEMRLRCHNGTWKWVLTRGMVVEHDADARPLRMIGTHTDITERKQAQAQEAERLAWIEENRAAVHHAQRLEALGQLTGGVAHDFNNVLQIIGGNLSLLERHLAGNPAATGRVAAAFKGVERGAKLSAQLLTFARRQPLAPRVLGLGALLHGMRDMLGQALGVSIVLHIDVAAHLWPVMVDPSQLENVLLNLALNARDAMQGVGSLRFEARNGYLESPDIAVRSELLLTGSSRVGPDAMADADQRTVASFQAGQAWRADQDAGSDPRGDAADADTPTAVDAASALQSAAPRVQSATAGAPTAVLPAAGRPEYAVLTITDTGSGMSAAVLEHAFEPFFTTKAAGQGTGLGLSMAYGFIKQSGGDIRIASSAGVGTAITVYLPRSLAAPTADAGSGMPAQAPGGTETILVVEDDGDLRAAVAAMLAELGYRVLTTGDADGALRLLGEGVGVDMLFSDVVMPGTLSGVELARRACVACPGLVVLFTSGYTLDALMHDKRFDRSASLLSKPYQREQLAMAVRSAFATRAQAG